MPVLPSELRDADAGASAADVLTQATAGQEPPVEQLLRTYCRGLSPEDLVERGPAALLAAVQAHLEVARTRPPGSAVVRVLPPAEGPTVALVVTDDMPFLVDSLTAELTRRGAAVHAVIHPVLVVQRDGAGRLQEVETGGGMRESWIRLEIDGEPEPDTLADDLARVLADVRAAVQDWEVMRERAFAAADRLPDEQRALLRWLAEDHFTFLGALELQARDGREPVSGSGSGLLRQEGSSRLLDELRERAPSAEPLRLTKASVRSSVHRPVYLDVVWVRPAGDRELVLVGLLAAAAYTESVRRIPVARQKVAEVLALSGLPADSYDGRDLLQVLETFPRDELFQTDAADLTRIATGVLRLRERRQLRVFLRRDTAARYLSVLAYLPRDRYTTRVRLAMAAVLREVLTADSVDYTARVTESVLARVHFGVRVDAPRVLPDVDVAALEARLAAATRSWTDDLAATAAQRLGAREAARLLRTFGESFPEAYKEDFSAATALDDLQRLAALDPQGPVSTTTYAVPGEPPDQRRIKLYRDGPLSLSDVLPALQSLGVDVLDERPYELSCGDGCSRWVYDFGLRYRPGSAPPDGPDPLLEEAFAAIWAGLAETDRLNALVTRARLPWGSVAVLRAYATYLRQTASTYSQVYVQDVLAGAPDFAGLLVALFEARLRPAPDGSAPPPGPEEALVAQATAALDEVASLDADRILRALLALVLATVRTNAFTGQEATDQTCLALKLDPRRVPGLPEPRPEREIWVYSPRFEGVHLRFGAVARGGLRWSDRREDFRTEVLGLVKAQTVKNAVIVPTGAKGGFVGKRLPDPAVDRAAWLAEGVACYRGFISGLLDLTDNLVDGVVVPPPGVLRLDGDDPYLVVAADKGTATFSDTANEVAESYGFWLGDAFASGGSAGYDHKAMGITARGAWVSVQRHFRELEVDVQRDEVTVVGIGDMSGDVFGNGMLLSKTLRLVAAFDHRHVFLDPDPDPLASWGERRRLFELPRSSWADYDPALISEGGGVFPRTAKRVPLTPQVRARLGLPDDVEALTPPELLRAVLTAPVDLLWNGGIGTYVKASAETHDAVGDHANDAIRVDGRSVRARVVGDGGNLGFTQLGRVEYALAGGRLNTDAIDNSAGVDTSDHEVNYKILLAPAVRDGTLTVSARNALLAELQDDVARLVLRDNAGQNLALGVARSQAAAMAPVHARFLDALEARGRVDRAIEFLPASSVMEQRAALGLGLTSPELSVLLAYAKIALREDLLASPVPEDPWCAQALRAYVPPALVERFGDRLAAHPLSREIITTTVVNDVVDTGGLTFAFRAAEETGATSAEVVRAYAVAREVFALPDLWASVERLDGVVPTTAQQLVLLEGRRLLDRTTRWLLQARRSRIDVAAEVARFGPPLAALTPQIPDLLVGTEALRLERRGNELAAAGLPGNIALRTAALLDAFSLLDVVAIATSAGTPAERVARLYFALSDRFEIDRLLTAISGLPRGDRWQALARSALRYDLYAALAGITADVLAGAADGDGPDAAIDRWERANAEGLTRARGTLAEVLLAELADLATLSVALRTVRTLLPA